MHWLEIDAAIREAFPPIFAKLCASPNAPDGIRARLARRLMPELRQHPRAAFVALRATDTDSEIFSRAGLAPSPLA